MRFVPSKIAAISRLPWRHAISLVLLAVFATATPEQSHAQGKKLGGFGLGGGGLGLTKQVTFTASYQLAEGAQEGRVSVVANIEPGWHLYSVVQQPPPQATVIKVQHEAITIAGPFTANQTPEIAYQNEIWPDLPLEELHDEVVWTAPFKVSGSFDAEKTNLPIKITGQVCMTGGSCVPVSEKLEAEYSGTYAEQARIEELRIEGTHAVWSATIEPASVKPGGSAVIRLSALTDKGYHVYPFVANDAETRFRTMIVATAKSNLRFGAPTTAVETESVDAGLDAPVVYHKGPVEWMIPVTVPENAAAGVHELALQVGFMTCNDRSCDPPSGIELKGNLEVSGDASSNSPAVMTLASVKYRDVIAQPNLADWIDTDEAKAEDKPAQTLSERASGAGLEPWMIFAALVGGFILNFMPCVLPVIGLKLMSFVNQADNNHGRVVALNLTYVAGILAVMLVLAGFNISAKLAGEAFGWGQQFQHLGFQVPLTVLIFAMALSFLGVWEIPIPGFATTSKSGELLEKEGLSGAFFKGVLTTVLATPCSGPFLGTIFGLTLTLSVTSILLLYIMVGIGLGIPYLALCVSPALLKMLPKPGAWMETLKQVLAFPLLLSVVYFVSLINDDYRIATLGLLIIVWFACWLIGRVPAYAEGRRIRAVWASGAATIAVGALVMFSFFGPSNHQLPWIPYNEATLAKFRAEGKTVMVEFTARWCLTCQSNMKFAIDRPRVASLVSENDVVPLLADWSEPSDEILNKIKELESLSIPLLAIYPPEPGAEPIILRDVITESQLLEALEQAGPSAAPKGKLTSAPVN